MKNERTDKTKIDGKLLLKDSHYISKTAEFVFMIIAGIIILLIPLTYQIRFAECVPHMVLMAFISVPFWWIGATNIAKIYKTKKRIQAGEYCVEEDYVTYKQVVQHGKEQGSSDDYCQMYLNRYSAKTNKAVIIPRQEYETLKNGDKFYLVYIDGEMRFFYPTDKYEI